MGKSRQYRDGFGSLRRVWSSPFENKAPPKPKQTSTKLSTETSISTSFKASGESKDSTKVLIKPNAALEANPGIKSPTTRPDHESLEDIDTIDTEELQKAHLESVAVFHIYHAGNRIANFNFHSVPDKDAILPQIDDPLAPNYVDCEKLRNHKPGLIKRVSTLGLAGKKPPTGPRFVKRSVMVRQPHLDLRTATAPYFVHQPAIGAKHLPLTLRRGGSKESPTACLISGHFMWRKFEIVLDDRLAQEGVIDGRGVVSAKYGTEKGQAGTLRGHKFKKRSRGETGKRWAVQELARRKALKKEGQHVNDDFTEPITPEEVVWLRWKHPLTHKTRTYEWKWRGFDFLWKGTATVRDAKFMGHTVAFNHLKLVVKPPNPNALTDGNRSKEKPAFICLAKYTSVVASRKAGRLEVFNDVADEFCNRFLMENGNSGMTTKAETSKLVESNDELVPEPFKVRQRLQDLIIATALCMIRSEEVKRELAIDLLIAAAESGGG
ncbi:MAG: hypothetical protein M1814_005392 [Vezdaea aestivalis]|nr:MAG: hypothetical protein M1814_005392 [Vezdaea aestivalis]